MATWQQFELAAPQLASAVRARFEAHRHHVLATLRADGSPRVSGTEARIHGGDLTTGSMWQSLKAHDLRRDPRFALHANPGDGAMVGGDAKVAGRAVEITDELELARYRAVDQPPGSFHLFLLGVEEAVLTEVVDDRLLIRTWRPGHPVRVVQR